MPFCLFVICEVYNLGVDAPVLTIMGIEGSPCRNQSASALHEQSTEMSFG